MGENETDSNLIHTIKCSWMNWSTAGMRRHGVHWWLHALWTIWAFPKAVNITFINSFFMKPHFIFSTFHVEQWELQKSFKSSALPSRTFLPFPKQYTLKRNYWPDWIYFFIYTTYEGNLELNSMFHKPVQKCFYHEIIITPLKSKSVTHSWHINSRMEGGYVELFSAAINCTWLCFWST